MKKLLSLLLSSAMLISCLMLSAVAVDSIEPGELTISAAENNIPMDIDSSTATITELPMVLSDDFTEDTQAIEFPSDDFVMPVDLPASANGMPINTRQRSANNEFHFSGTIAEPNGMFAIYPIVLNNRDNIHAELIGPSNSALNYDLRLYEMDASTGELISLVDICAYSSASALPQTVATINRASSAKTYALIVYALTGSSATETFDVNITVGHGGDPAESNDNAFTAYNLDVMTVNGYHISGTTLDSAKDSDWFIFAVPQQTDFAHIKISNAANSNVKFQLYYVSSGTTLVELKEVNGRFPVRTGAIYLRVTDNGNNFAGGDVAYEPVIAVSFSPTKISSTFQMNEYNDIPTQTYKVWNLDETEYHPEKRNALLGSCRLVWTATFLSPSGYICTDATNSLHIRVTNTSWVPVEFQSASKDSAPAVNGVATCVLEKSVGCRGVYQGVSYMSYDVACTLNMWADGFPSITDGAMPIFVTSRIMT